MPTATKIPRSAIAADTVSAGSATGDATVLGTGGHWLFPVTAADGTKGVRLHAVQAFVGSVIKIGNRVSTAILRIYPPTGGTINGAAANVAYQTPSGNGATLVCTASASGGTWITV